MGIGAEPFSIGAIRRSPELATDGVGEMGDPFLLVIPEWEKEEHRGSVR